MSFTAKTSLSVSQFRTELEKARDRFHTGTGRTAQLRAVSDYARIAFDTHLGRTLYLKEYTSDEITEYVDLFPDLKGYIDRFGAREGFWRWSRSLPRKVKRLIYQQLLVFSITIFEAFINDALLLVFLREPMCLSSERNITWSEVLKLGDFDSLIDYFAAHRVSAVLSGDWYKIVEEFRKLFDIDLSDEIESKSLAEIFEIRHTVVHNVGIVDEQFLKKVTSSEWGVKYRVNEEIILNDRLFQRMLNYIDYSVNCIYDSLLNKFG